MLRVLADERELLKSLYQSYGIPTDQYNVRVLDLERFTAQWNRLTERNDDPFELLHFMVNQRKDKKNAGWPRLNGNHKKKPPIPADLLDQEEWKEAAQALC